MNPSAAPHDPPTVLTALTAGFAGVITTWILAWILHLPAIDASAAVTLPVLLVGLVGAYFAILRAHPPAGRMKTALLAGLVTGLVNLMIVGSVAVEQPESTDAMAQYANQFRSEALVIIPASILFCIIAGAIAAAVAGFARPARRPLDTQEGWLARLAMITVLVYLPLIVVGGAVTSTESGLAVPDAVTSYGAISVLFPFELMSEPRIFLEHSHRLFGTLAGLTTIVLMVCVLVYEPRKAAKVLAVLLLVAVCVQGYAGAMRVAEQSVPIAIAHGIFGQVVFASAAALAAVLSLSWRALPPDADRQAVARKSSKLAWVMLGALFLQIVGGAVARHFDRIDPESVGAGHARLAHAAFAFVVMFLIILGGSLAIRTGKAGAKFPPVRNLGVALHATVTFQFLLGWATLGLIMTRDTPAVVPTADQLATAPPIRTVEALVTTAHQTTGALLLLLATVTTLWLGRLARDRTAAPLDR